MDTHWMSLMELKIIKMVMIFQKLPGKNQLLKIKNILKNLSNLEREKKSVLNLDLYQSIEFETLLSYATFIVQSLL